MAIVIPASLQKFAPEIKAVMVQIHAAKVDVKTGTAWLKNDMGLNTRLSKSTRKVNLGKATIEELRAEIARREVK